MNDISVFDVGMWGLIVWTRLRLNPHWVETLGHHSMSFHMLVPQEVTCIAFTDAREGEGGERRYFTDVLTRQSVADTINRGDCYSVGAFDVTCGQLARCQSYRIGSVLTKVVYSVNRLYGVTCLLRWVPYGNVIGRELEIDRAWAPPLWHVIGHIKHAPWVSTSEGHLLVLVSGGSVLLVDGQSIALSA